MDICEKSVLNYLLLLNVLTLVFFGWDKQLSRHGSTRIPEKTLWWLSILGGSLGGWAGMYLFRHKTRHLQFRLGIPAILIVQSILLVYFYDKLT